MGWRSRVLAERVNVTRCGGIPWVLGMHIFGSFFFSCSLGGVLSQRKVS
mgnify:CR=1 FL=1